MVNWKSLHISALSKVQTCTIRANWEGLSNDDIKKKESIHTKVSSWLVSLVSLPLPGLPWTSTKVALFDVETEQLSPAKREKRSMTLELCNDEVNRLSGSCRIYFTRIIPFVTFMGTSEPIIDLFPARTGRLVWESHWQRRESHRFKFLPFYTSCEDHAPP